MIDLMPAFNDLMETINNFSFISLQIEEYNQSLAEVDKRLERIIEAQNV
jgi:hypothetical protein